MSTAKVGSSILTMPRLGETMEHGIVSDWFVQAGESFKRGDALIEFETDKTAVEYPALGDGVLIEQLVQPGDQVTVGEPLALIDTGSGPDWLTDGAGEELSNVADNTSAAGSVLADMDPGCTDPQRAGQNAADLEQTGVLRATPAARRHARALGIPLNSLSGTGRRGRVEVHDVESAADTRVSRSGRSDRPSNAINPIETHTTTLQFVDGIAYSVSGPPSGIPYLLLHGFAADGSAWSLLARTLAKAGCRVFVADLPGHGATHREAHGVEELSAGLASILATHHVDAQPWHLIAHSLGTVPALQLAQTLVDSPGSDERLNSAAIASLTLIAPIGLGLSIDAEFVRGVANPSSVGELAHLLRRLSDRPSTLSEQAQEDLYRSLKRGRLVKLAESLLGTQGQRINTHRIIQSLSGKLPTRIIIGHVDHIIDWQQAMQVSCAVAVHHFPNAGHMPHWDQPAEVSDIILSGQ